MGNESDTPGKNIRRHLTPQQQLVLFMALGGVNNLTHLTTMCVGRSPEEWESAVRKMIQKLTQTIMEITGIPEGSLPQHPDAWLRWVRQASEEYGAGGGGQG